MPDMIEMEEQVLFSFNDVLRIISNVISSHSTIIFLLGAVIVFIFALYGYKLLNILMTVLDFFVGLGFGAIIGTVIVKVGSGLKTEAELETVAESFEYLNLLPIVLAGLLSIFLAYQAYERPFKLINVTAGTITFFLCFATFYTKMMERSGGQAPSNFAFIINGIVFPALITAVVCLLFHFMLFASIVISTSYTGAWLGSLCLAGAMPFNVNKLLVAIIALALGTLCMLYQIRTTKGKCTVKEFLSSGRIRRSSPSFKIEVNEVAGSSEKTKKTVE